MSPDGQKKLRYLRWFAPLHQNPCALIYAYSSKLLTKAALLSEVLDAEIEPFFLGSDACVDGRSDWRFLVVTLGVDVTGSFGLGAVSALQIKARMKQNPYLPDTLYIHVYSRVYTYMHIHILYLKIYTYSRLLYTLLHLLLASSGLKQTVQKNFL